MAEIAFDIVKHFGALAPVSKRREKRYNIK